MDEVRHRAVALFRLRVYKDDVSLFVPLESWKLHYTPPLTSGCVTASTMLFSQVRKTGLAVSGEKAEKSRKVWTVKPPLMRRMPSERRGASAAPKWYCVAGDRSDGMET